VLDVLRPALPALIEVASNLRLARGRSDLDGQELRMRTDVGDYQLRLPILGPFQAENLATAVVALEQLGSFGVDTARALTGKPLEKLRLPGRLEVIKRRPLVLIDLAESIAALQRVAASITELSSARPLHVVLDARGRTDTADLVRVISTLKPAIAAIGGDRTLMECCYDENLSVQSAASVLAAVDQAIEEVGERGAIAVLGSRSAAADARAGLLGLMPADLRLN
jgi:dihydrofolate synthase / folylpolyglutamate synthase